MDANQILIKKQQEKINDLKELLKEAKTELEWVVHDIGGYVSRIKNEVE